MLKAESSLSMTDSPTAQAPSWVTKALRVEWLGQTVASLCWIVSVFVYGLTSLGDALQLAAATAWFIANLAALFSDNG